MGYQFFGFPLESLSALLALYRAGSENLSVAAVAMSNSHNIIYFLEVMLAGKKQFHQHGFQCTARQMAMCHDRQL
jgi:hypothetical protein